MRRVKSGFRPNQTFHFEPVFKYLRQELQQILTNYLEFNEDALIMQVDV
jgi:hypothetical protein